MPTLAGYCRVDRRHENLRIPTRLLRTHKRRNRRENICRAKSVAAEQECERRVLDPVPDVLRVVGWGVLGARGAMAVDDVVADGFAGGRVRWERLVLDDARGDGEDGGG